MVAGSTNLTLFDKAKTILGGAWWLAPIFLVVIIYCVLRMKKRNVKLWGR
jgi:hypothetical protein